MDRFKEFLKRQLPVGYVGLDNDAEPLKELIKKYGPNLPMGFAGFLKKDKDDLANPENWDIKEEAPPPVQNTVRIPEYHYPHIEHRPNEHYSAREQEPGHFTWEESHLGWQNLLKSIGSHANLTATMMHGISEYTKSSRDLNQYLIRKHTGDNPLDYDGFEERHHALMEAASRTKTPAPMTLYSGVFLTHPGRHPAMHLPAFTSMSYNPDVATGFAKADEYSRNHTHIISWAKGATIGSAIMSHADTAAYYNQHFGHSDQAARELATKYGMPEDHYHAFPKPIHHVLRLHVPEGSHVIVPNTLAKYQTEKEVIAPAGSTIRVNHDRLPQLFGDSTLVHNVTLETPKL